ncbi:sulfotransferase family 2 domain-containing protein [Nocardioides sp. J9]|uniref:sulfotransferase family 2 domain-containing protein n=1 Tax=Nocardioides sp. J9 TaxID=935844 RepID=UPI0011A4134C|nr:sulfotransferase family 2 domain-containing protein [Nocardioides sp. J9]
MIDGQPATDAMLTRLREIPGGVWRTYIAPESKVVFEALNKNACTSLKWMMADLAGEDPASFRARDMPYLDDSEPIHNRDLWKISPRLDSLTPAQRAEIHPDNGWFVFAVVRDPRVRLFSAWQNKLLIETPFSVRWAKEWWYPRHPLTAETVIEDFAKFVDLMGQEEPHWLRAKDAHFRDQVEMLGEDAVPYTKIYDISEIKQLQADLNEHLAAQGRPPVKLPRANPTPLKAIGALYENGVREKIESIYAADFERFGHLWDFSRTEAAEPWTQAALNACEQEASLGKRIGELYRIARDRKKELADTRAELDAAKRRIAELEARTSLRGQARAAASRLRRR